MSKAPAEGLMKDALRRFQAIFWLVGGKGTARAGKPLCVRPGEAQSAAPRPQGAGESAADDDSRRLTLQPRRPEAGQGHDNRPVANKNNHCRTCAPQHGPVGCGVGGWRQTRYSGHGFVIAIITPGPAAHQGIFRLLDGHTAAFTLRCPK